MALVNVFVQAVGRPAISLFAVMVVVAAGHASWREHVISCLDCIACTAGIKRGTSLLGGRVQPDRLDITWSTPRNSRDA